MSEALIKELKLLGVSEELVIRNDGRCLMVTRRLKLPYGCQTIDTSVTFQRMENALFDILAETLREQRDHICSPELKMKRVANRDD